MSYYEDFYNDMLFADYCERSNIESDAQEGIWTTKDGTRLRIKDMSTEHIKNCIRCIERNDTTDMYYAYVVVFENELKARGE